MMFPAVLLLVLATNLCLTLVSSVSDKKPGIQDNESLRPRRNKECRDGFGGINCKDDVNECQASSYPCAGGNKTGSFCVDYDPPEKFKCGCLPGYNAVLPDATELKDPVPLEWRPLMCLPRDACVDFVCHEDATCIVSSTTTAVCICNNNLVGDGIANCSPPVVVTKAPLPPRPACKVDSDCNKLERSVCVEGFCKCKAGFYQSNGKGHCINENECAPGYPNDCHKHAFCTDTEGSYTCACKDGYHDLNPNDKPGAICAQTNECINPSMHDCNNETQVCLDRPPPLKWQCVERTPAPTPQPTQFCSRPPGTGAVLGTAEYGCEGQVCVQASTQTIPPKVLGGGDTCAVCFNDQADDTVKDTGCDDSFPICDASLFMAGSQCLAPSGCFPGLSEVLVQDKGLVAMKDLMLGDRVLVAVNKYEPIYSFGHYDADITVKYLELRTASAKLEITNDHMVFIDNAGAFPASAVKVGDKLILTSGNVEVVEAIKSTIRKGAFVPLTASGTIVVNGVKASTFISFQKDSPVLMLGGVSTRLSYQWLLHTFELPHRVWCSYLGDCLTENYVDGFSTWIYLPLKFANWLFNLKSGMMMAFVSLPILVYIAVLFMTSILFSYPFVAVAIFFGAKVFIFAAKNKSVYKA
jgi:Hint module/Calcium-binding EGF domain